VQKRSCPVRKLSCWPGSPSTPPHRPRFGLSTESERRGRVGGGGGDGGADSAASDGAAAGATAGEGGRGVLATILGDAGAEAIDGSGAPAGGLGEAALDTTFEVSPRVSLLGRGGGLRLKAGCVSRRSSCGNSWPFVVFSGTRDVIPVQRSAVAHRHGNRRRRGRRRERQEWAAGSSGGCVWRRGQAAAYQ
jgi:hypothetical protein